MNWSDHIEQNPEVLCGKPHFKGTRMGVGFVLERLGQGATAEVLLAAHPQLKAEHIQAALAYAAAYMQFDTTIWVGEGVH